MKKLFDALCTFFKAICLIGVFLNLYMAVVANAFVYIMFAILFGIFFIIID